MLGDKILLYTDSISEHYYYHNYYKVKFKADLMLEPPFIWVIVLIISQFVFQFW